MYIYTYIHIFILMYTCMHIYICTRIYTHIHIHAHLNVPKQEFLWRMPEISTFASGATCFPEISEYIHAHL